MGKREYPDYPRVGVGAVVIKDGGVLMVKRAARPNKNLWAIPGGMLELGETLQEGAQREIYEETGIRIKAGKPVYTFELLERDATERVLFHYLVVDLEAEYLEGDITPASDALDARWVTPEECTILPLSHQTRNILRTISFLPTD